MVKARACVCVVLKGSEHQEPCYLLPFPHKMLKVVTRRSYCGASLLQEVQSGEVWSKWVLVTAIYTSSSVGMDVVRP